MADKFDSKSSTVQRNEFDVALELTRYYAKREGCTGHEVGNVFAKFYAMARCLKEKSPSELQNLVPSEIMDKIGRFK